MICSLLIVATRLRQSDPYCLFRLSLRSRARGPNPYWIEDGPIVAHVSEIKGLSRKCGKISPLKRNSYFERFPHRR